jgi:1-aminocyclopropane-1-carboxylate deaminase/D-cysteine desulfhydrase-like pyridoxal-dependent ACC family enzyme
MSARRAHGPDADTAALERLGSWPRVPLASLPTPLLRADRLGTDAGAEPLYLKMDAETGFALGGNKVRKLEVELAPERIRGVTCLITAGGPQSNHCRITAAFAARMGLRCILVVQGPEPERPGGNALLHRLFGAEIVTVADRTERTPTMAKVAARVRDEGGEPLVVPIGASTGLGSLGYARAAVELVEQIDALADGREETLLFVSASSCGTLAGLLLGFTLLDRPDVRLFGVSADAAAEDLRAITLALAAEGAALLEASPALHRISLETSDGQVGEGYGIPTPASTEALRRFARLEGVVLDPTYTAKAAAGMLAHLAERGVTAEQRVVFVHTGGHPGLLV